jgi:hypothetical protein
VLDDSVSLIADDDPDPGNACSLECLDLIVQNGPAAEMEKTFRIAVGRLLDSSAPASCQNDGSHFFTSRAPRH